ncbi:MAG: 50S ribosomal protein L9 [Bacteroidales bacterium]|nr:50S ribosomal protein L9 [Bacteroidales bacterium]
MDIILKQDVPNVGHENDIVTVKNGFARNYLIPQGMAIAATSSALKVRAENVRQKAHKEAKVKEDAEVLAKAIEGKSIRIGAKAASTGKIFGSVNAIQIAEALKEQHNFYADRKMIILDGDSIKQIGNYTAKVKLHKEVEVEINFEVYAEE